MTPRQRFIGSCVCIAALLPGFVLAIVLIFACRPVDGSAVERHAARLSAPPPADSR